MAIGGYGAAEKTSYSSSSDSLAASRRASASATLASAKAIVSARTRALEALDRELRTLSTDGAMPVTAGRPACSRFGGGSTGSAGLCVLELVTVCTGDAGLENPVASILFSLLRLLHLLLVHVLVEVE